MFEEAGVPYVDVGRLPESDGGGIQRIVEVRESAEASPRPFAPPILRVGGLTIAQAPLICDFLGRRFSLVPESEDSRREALQHQLTIADAVNEVHDTHHPLGGGLYYEDQRAEAKKRAATFRKERLPHWLHYFERLLTERGGDWLLGRSFSYVDLSLFQLVAGLRYAFPDTLAKVEPRAPRLVALHDRVSARPLVAKYLASDRRVPFNEDGIFRCYPELDAD